MNIIEISNYTKMYNEVNGIKDINLTVPEGCIMGVLGNNGAGKSTFIRSMLGLIKPNNICTNLHAPNGGGRLVQRLAKKI